VLSGGLSVGPPAGGRWRVGISGSGFVARAVAAVLARTPDFALTGVLTRRPVGLSAGHFPEGVPTNSRDALIERADIVFECSGDTAHAAEVLVAAGEAGRHLVTLNAEAQVTIGTELVHRGFSVTEAHGDQPGAQAELAEEARAIGFEPLAYVNFKGFHDPDPSPENMRTWSERQKSTVRAVTSYTDGGKLQIEQVLVANGLGAGIVRQGMIGGAVDDLHDLDHLAEAAAALGRPVSDYIVHPKGPKGVVIVASCPLAELTPDYSVFAKVRTRGGRGYTLLKPHYFVHLEVPKTLRRMVAGGPPLITNGLRPTALIAAVAKRAIPAGTRIETALGGFELRGEALPIEGHADAVPITLLDGARTRHAVEAGAVIREADVEVPETLARALWRRTVARVAKEASHAPA
jgi:predicted homoserine dehydrogenase-like protein